MSTSPFVGQVGKRLERSLRAQLGGDGSWRWVQRLLDIIAENPFQNPPPYEKLVGDLAGPYSRRINIQHRLVYQVYDAEHTGKVLRMWTHYE